MIYALFYDYVENIVERRAPHRPAHLALVTKWKAQGRFVMGGAIGEPPHGALIVLEVEDESGVQEFVDADPYIDAGLVTAHRVEPWHVV
jgi:uncharacterized protein YciI